MGNEMTKPTQADAIESALIDGNLSKLDAAQRVSFYNRTCESLGLNPLTKPFDYITLNGRLTLYARRDCTDQLRNLRTVAITIVSRETIGDVFVVTARASLPNGRTDESVGAVPTNGLKGEALANAYMKAETKAKRRVTLSICGLGMLDENEVASIVEPPPATRAVVNKPSELPPAAPENAETPPADPKKAFAVAVRDWSGMTGTDWKDACNAVAKKLGHESATGLHDKEYIDLAAFCVEAKAAGQDFLAATSAPETEKKTAPKLGPITNGRGKAGKPNASTVDVTTP